MLQQRIAIPAYFHSDSDPDWDTAKSARGLLKIVIFNPASGPGYTSPFLADPDGQEYLNFKDRITQMHNIGANIRANVLGYLTTNRRDSRPGDTVQREHRFTVDPATGDVTTRNSKGAVHETGWTKGFGPIQVRSAGTLPIELAIETNYFWIKMSPTTGRFATSKVNAMAGNGINHFTSVGGEGPNKNNHGMGLSRTLANIANVKFEIDEYYARWPDIDGIFFDEMNDVGDDDDKTYYKAIFDHVNTKAGKALVFQNPGRKFPELEDEEMFGVADTFITFEGASMNYAAHVPEPWMMLKPAEKFWHLIHSCPTSDMPTMIDDSRTKKAGYVYVTNRSPEEADGDGAWGHIASNFAAEIAKIKNANAGG